MSVLLYMFDVSAVSVFEMQDASGMTLDMRARHVNICSNNRL